MLGKMGATIYDDVGFFQPLAIPKAFMQSPCTKMKLK
jgi:hypothetical protein